jgi:hypothetical protein
MDLWIWWGGPNGGYNGNITNKYILEIGISHSAIDNGTNKYGSSRNMIA